MLTRTLAATLALVAMPGLSALARTGAIESSSCVEGYAGFSCSTIWAPAGDPYIRMVPGPRSPEEAAARTERDRKWMAWCHPAIRQDRYGVSRYRYAASRCEFGAIGISP